MPNVQLLHLVALKNAPARQVVAVVGIAAVMDLQLVTPTENILETVLTGQETHEPTLEIEQLEAYWFAGQGMQLKVQKYDTLSQEFVSPPSPVAKLR